MAITKWIGVGVCKFGYLSHCTQCRIRIPENTCKQLMVAVIRFQEDEGVSCILDDVNCNKFAW